MRTIALIAVVGILLVDFGGAIPNSSVGGPLTLLLIFFLAMLTVGIHEAWSNKRGVLGWIVSLAVSIAGGFLALEAGSLIMEMILPHMHLDGPLATSQHPLRYVASAGMMLLLLLGSWTALQVVNRFR